MLQAEMSALSEPGTPTYIKFARPLMMPKQTISQTCLPAGLDFLTHVGYRQWELCLQWLCLLVAIGKINITSDCTSPW